MADYEMILKRLNQIGVDNIPAELAASSELYISVLEVFCDDYEARNQSIEEYLQAKDYYNLRIQVHGIKGACYSIGAMGVGDAAKRLEFCCRAIENPAQDYGYSVDDALTIIDTELAPFMIRYKQLIEDISSTVNGDFSADVKGSADTNDCTQVGSNFNCPDAGTSFISDSLCSADSRNSCAVQTAASISVEDFSIYMQQIKFFAENYDLDPIGEVITLLNEYSLDPQNEELVKLIKKAADRFDYDTLQALVAKY